MIFKRKQGDGNSRKIAKVFTWGVFVALVSYSVYAGSNSSFAEAATTSSTTTVQVNATINPAINIYLSDDTINLTVATAGTDAYDENEVIVNTNSQDGYKLYAGQDKQLEHTDDGDFITEENMGGEEDPHPYNEDTTGLAFSLSGTSAESLWNADAGSVDCNYSSFTSGSGVEVNNWSTYSDENTTTTVFYRLDVTASQKSGTYVNHVDWYAVTND